MPRYVAFFLSAEDDEFGYYAVLDTDNAHKAIAKMHYRAGRALLPGVAAYRVMQPETTPVTVGDQFVQSVAVKKEALLLAGHCPACKHPYDAAGPAGICIGCPCPEKHPVTE